MFVNHQPKEGAEQLSKWAWDILEFHDGIPIPESLDSNSVEELLRHLSFGGDRFCFAIHFGLVAVARDELDEEEYRALLDFLGESVRNFEVSLTEREFGCLRLIAIGVVADHATMAWLEDSGALRPEAVDALIRLVVPSQDCDLIRCLADWAIREKQYDWVRTLLKLHAPNDDGQLCREILTKIPDDQINDSFLKDLFIYGLAKSDPETVQLYLPRLSSQYDRDRVEKTLSQIQDSERDGDQHSPLIRETVLEKNGIQKEEDLLRYEAKMLKQYTESKEDPELDYFEVENVAGKLCEVLAAYGDYPKLFQNIDKLSPKGCLRDVTDELFIHWAPDEDVPEILRIATALKGEVDEELDDNTYMVERFLILLAYQLASQERYSQAINIADVLFTQFAETEGRECVATWYLWRGDYEEAKHLGGATPDRYWCPVELQRVFIPGGAFDEEAIQYYRSTKDWDQSLEALMRIAWHGSPRLAMHHLLRYEIRNRIAEWVYDPYYEDRKDYPRDYEALCLLAETEARNQIKYHQRNGPLTPPEIRAFRVALLAIVGFMNLLIYRNWHGKTGENRKQERGDDAKEEACRLKLEEGLEKAKQETDRETRVGILTRLPSALCYVSRSLHDRYIDGTALQVALRAEFPKLREIERSIQSYRAASQWGTLAGAMLESHDLLGAIEAWTEYEKFDSISPNRSEDLVKHTQPENWHLVAPFCRSNPHSAAILAAKLNIWFPEIRKPKI